MPVILTDRYKDSTFFIPYTADKSEGVFCKPMTETKRNAIRREAIQEAGHDQELFVQIFGVRHLGAAISGWKGFRDAGGEDIPYAKDALKSLIDCDPDFFGELSRRVNSVARYGELADEKN